MGKELAQKITGGKLSWGTRLSYASGDVACNVVFGMIGTLLTLFYTDYVGNQPGYRRPDDAAVKAFLTVCLTSSWVLS